MAFVLAANTRLTVSLVLIVLALVFAILAAMGKMPLWPAVFLLVLERLFVLLDLLPAS